MRAGLGRLVRARLGRGARTYLSSDPDGLRDVALDQDRPAVGLTDERGPGEVEDVADDDPVLVDVDGLRAGSGRHKKWLLVSTDRSLRRFKLPSGRTLTISIDGDVLMLPRDERKFVMATIDSLEETFEDAAASAADDAAMKAREGE